MTKRVFKKNRITSAFDVRREIIAMSQRVNVLGEIQDRILNPEGDELTGEKWPDNYYLLETYKVLCEFAKKAKDPVKKVNTEYVDLGRRLENTKSAIRSIEAQLREGEIDVEDARKNYDFHVEHLSMLDREKLKEDVEKFEAVHGRNPDNDNEVLIRVEMGTAKY